MTTKRYNTHVRDWHIFRGVFRGRKLMAFGREQVLDYTAKLNVLQAQVNPPVWVARDTRGMIDPAFNSASAAATMRAVEQSFTTCLESWQSYESGGLQGERKLGPQLVKKIERTA